MSEDKNLMDVEEDGAIIVEFNDDAGNSLYYQQEMIIPVDGVDYALLVGVNVENETESDEDDEENVIIAKIVKDANGEDEYVDLTDEEFAKVEKAYNEICDAEGVED